MTPVGSSEGTILVVEDDPDVLQTLTEYLELSGYTVLKAMTASEAKDLIDQHKIDLVSLDLKLPDADGLVFCSDLRTRLPSVPIIIVSGSTEKRDGILSLRLGADDYMSKPFDIDEYEARVAALLRRACLSREGEKQAAVEASSDVLEIGGLRIEQSRRKVTLNDTLLALTPTEYRLLVSLVTRVDNVVSRQDLAEEVWGYVDASIGRSIDVHIRRLRVKLATAGSTPPPPIVSVRGFGYKIVSGTPKSFSFR